MNFSVVLFLIIVIFADASNNQVFLAKTKMSLYLNIFFKFINKINSNKYLNVGFLAN